MGEQSSGTLTMLLVLDLRIDTHGQLHCQLVREDIPLNASPALGPMGNSGPEYMAGMHYVLDRTWAIKAYYDREIGMVRAWH